jgi:hypothetical protein
VSDSKNIHWTENEELLEQFVLGRLKPAEIAELEKHLQECDQCRKVVTNELELVAGIRLAGRESMKHKLAERLAQRKAHSATWYRVAGVAAGIVLLVAAGIYNRWFTGIETRMERRERSAKIGTRVEPAPQVSPERQVSKAGKPSVGVSRGASDEQRQKVPNLAAGAPKAAGAKSGDIAEAQVGSQRDLKAAETSREGESREKRDRSAAGRAASPIPAIWVQGTVISERDRNVPAPQMMVANAKDEHAVLRKGKADKVPAGKPAKIEVGENAGPNFVITQKLLSDLPQSQQVRQQTSSLVQTLLQKNLTGTRITVFLDSLLTKKEFDQVRVQMIREDSIILILGNRLVGYKLPPDWTEQEARQTRKEK